MFSMYYSVSSFPVKKFSRLNSVVLKIELLGSSSGLCFCPSLSPGIQGSNLAWISKF